jgi:uncharacterized protein YraI
MGNSKRRTAAAAGVATLLLPVMAGCAVHVAGAAVRGTANVTSSVNAAPVGDVAGTVIEEANVRSGPGMSYDIVTSLPLGAPVMISCASGEWMRLATPYAGGYVYNNLLSLQGTPKPC